MFWDWVYEKVWNHTYAVQIRLFSLLQTFEKLLYDGNRLLVNTAFVQLINVYTVY